MKAPKITGVLKQLKAAVRPDGGVNLCKAPGEIADNQASDMLNMWHDGNALRLRPGLAKRTEQLYGPVIDVYPKDGRRLLLKRVTVAGQVTEEKYGVYIVTRNAVLSYDGAVFERVPCITEYNNGVWSYSYIDFTFDSCIILPSGNIENSQQDSSLITYKAEGDSVYVFGSGYFLTITPEVLYWPFPAGEIHVAANYFVTFKTQYIPTIFSDTPPAGGGVRNEARNFLTPLVYQTFTADQVSTIYRLCDSELDNETVAVDYLNPLTNILTTFLFGVDITQTTVRGITVTLDRDAGTLVFSTALIGAAGIKNNVKVTYEKTVYPTVPILYCDVGDWYGDYGGKNGGGSRIFLAGFKDGANILYYSAADDPSYFPDDAVITVGDPADPVTAFGKQFDILVVFKEHSIYSVSGGLDDDFSVKLVHSGDGCDMPRSIQTVSNVLVFANTYGGIYMLHSTQIKDERALERLSENINSALLTQQISTLKNACSVNTGSYYILFAGSCAFCLDCRDNVLTSTANLKDKLAFYIWELPLSVAVGFIYGGAVCLVSGADNDIYALDNDVPDDGGEWFRAYWRSKAFDFGQPEVLKKASALWVGLLNKEAAAVGIGCPYENGAPSIPIYLNPVQNSDQRERRCTVRAAVTGQWSGSIMISVERLPDKTAAFGLESVSLWAAAGAQISYGGD